MSTPPVPPRKNPEDPFTDRECRLILQHYLEGGTISMNAIAYQLNVPREAIMQACRRANETEHRTPYVRKTKSGEIDLSLIKGIHKRPNRCLLSREKQLVIECLRVNAGIRGAQAVIAKALGMSPCSITPYSCKAAAQEGRR